METEELTPKILVSGLAFGFNLNFKIPEISELNREINSITIQTFDKKNVISMDLSLLLENIKMICLSNEEKIGEFFKTQGWKLCDWSKRQDIMINIKSEDKIN